MKNHREVMEALLAGKTLVAKQETFNWTLYLTPEGNFTQVATYDNILFKARPEEWEIKAEMITINGVEVPAPERSPLQKGTTYYVPCFTSGELCYYAYWQNRKVDLERLQQGLVHLEIEAAQAHTKALLSFTVKEEL